LLLATLTRNWWYPLLTDEEFSAAIGTLGNLTDVGMLIGTGVLAIMAYLGWRRPKESDAASALNSGSTVQYVQKRAYEPNSIDGPFEIGR